MCNVHRSTEQHNYIMLFNTSMNIAHSSLHAVTVVESKGNKLIRNYVDDSSLNSLIIVPRGDMEGVRCVTLDVIYDIQCTTHLTPSMYSTLSLREGTHTTDLTSHVWYEFMMSHSLYAWLLSLLYLTIILLIVSWIHNI